MTPRKNEFKTSLNRTEYARIRRNAIVAMGFCPECYNPLLKVNVCRCDECAIKGKMRFHKRLNDNN